MKDFFATNSKHFRQRRNAVVVTSLLHLTEHCMVNQVTIIQNQPFNFKILLQHV